MPTETDAVPKPGMNFDSASTVNHDVASFMALSSVIGVDFALSLCFLDCKWARRGRPIWQGRRHIGQTVNVTDATEDSSSPRPMFWATVDASAETDETLWPPLPTLKRECALSS